MRLLARCAIISARMPDQPPRRRGRPSEGVREAIVAATLELIASAGLAGLTTREIARHAHVSEASIHYHFGSKGGLLQAAILDGLEPLKTLGGELADDGAGDRPVGEALLAIARALERFFDRAVPVLATIQADATLRAEFSRRFAAEDLGPHRGVRLVERYLASAQHAGRVDRHADTGAAALWLVGSCFLRAWQRHLMGRRRQQRLPSLEQTVAGLAAQLSPR